MKFSSKSLLSACALLALAGSASVSAAPLPAPFNEYGVDATVNFTASAAYNSNVLSAPGTLTPAGNTKFDDYIFTFAPGLTLDWGKNALTDVTFNFTETFYRYDKHPSLNAELSNVALDVNRQQGAFDLSTHASYVQNYNNTPSAFTATSPTLTSIIRFDTITASGDVKYTMSDKFNFDLGASFTQNHYLYTVGKAYQDTDTYTLPATAYYVYTPELSFGLGYTYSQTDPKNNQLTGAAFSPGRDRDTHTVSLNALLTKWQKLTGSANVGVSRNSIDGIGPVAGLTTTTVSYGLDLTYAYSEKLAFNLTGSRNFSTGSAGQNIEATGGGLGAAYTLSDTIGIKATLINFTRSEYLQQVPSRTDDAYSSGITVNWSPLDYLTFSAAYTYFMNSSTAVGATYNVNQVSISGTIHY